MRSIPLQNLEFELHSLMAVLLYYGSVHIIHPHLNTTSFLVVVRIPPGLADRSDTKYTKVLML